MPRLIDAPQQDAIELDELVERLSMGAFDGRDEDCFASWGNALKQLANNRRFLGDLVIQELKAKCDNQVRGNQFSPQVILLHNAPGFYIRANFWPALTDSVVTHSGTSPFFYGLAHDHNFSFLTVGYAGPGYWSEYYEYDYEDVVGYVGQEVELRFVEKSRLEPGKVMLYRAHRDVHLQLPADAMSVSLNIVENDYAIPFSDQYRFDVRNGRIDGLLTALSLEQMLSLTAHLGGENGIDLLEQFAAKHPSDRIRFRALKARASLLADADDRIALFEQAARQDNPFVSAMAKREAELVERGRAWIERLPASA